MKTIKINFCDFWDNFKINDFYVLNDLKKFYKFELSEEPDYIIYSCFSDTHLYKNPNAIRIFYTGENIVPNFNIADYAIGFEKIEDNFRYIRMPIYNVLTPYIKSLIMAEKKHELFLDNRAVLNRKFCNFIVSNPYDNTNRSDMFNMLSEYKKIDSGGKYLNNIGYIINDKLSFIKNYKFSLCFENSSHIGYVTEKIIEAFAANTIPIYFGDPTIISTINEKSFINVKSIDDFGNAIEKIKFLDNNDDAYIDMIKEKVFISETFNNNNNKLFCFFKNIFDKPYNQAKILKPIIRKKYFLFL